MIQAVESHSEAVRCVVLSADGARAVSGSRDRSVRVWSTDTGQARTLATLSGYAWRVQVLMTLKGHTNWVLSVARSLDGGKIVSGSNDRTVCVWNTATGQVGHPASSVWLLFCQMAACLMWQPRRCMVGGVRVCVFVGRCCKR